MYLVSSITTKGELAAGGPNVPVGYKAALIIVVLTRVYLEKHEATLEKS